MIFKIAWRNIWRNKKRSLVIIMAIGFGMWAGIIMIALMNGMLDQMVNNSINSRLSHIQIHHPDYKKDQDIKYFIKNSTLKESDERILATSKRLLINGMVSSSYSNRGIQIIGINPQEERSVTNIYQFIKEGKYFETKRRNPVIISRRIAKKLNVSLRNKIVLSFQDINGEISSGAFRIVGIFDTQNAMIDENMLFINIQDLNRLVSDQTIVNEILVKLSDNNNLETVSGLLKENNPDLLVESWKDLDPYLKVAVESNQQQFMVFVLIIMIALGFGILNTMLMSVLERIKEIGTLLSIGMKHVKVFSMIMLETICLSIVAIILGLSISIISNSYLAKSGIDLSMVSEGLSKFGLNSIIYPVLGHDTYIMFVGFVIVTALVSAVYPAYKAIRLKPNEALHYL